MTAATDAATAPNPLADPENRHRLDLAKAFAFQLLKGIKQIGMYRHNEARYTEYLSKAHEAIKHYTDRFGPLVFKVEQQNFALFDQPLFSEDTPLPFKFWRDGIRQFIFRPGLRPDELLTFTLVALSDVEKQGEDTVAQLWRSPLDNLEYVVVEGFKVDGFTDEEVQVSVDKIVEYLYSRLRSHSDDFLRFARVSAEDLDLKLEGVEQVRGAVIAGVTATDDLKARLQKEITEEEKSRLFPKLVSSIFQVAEAGVDDPELLEDMFLQLLDALLLQEDFAIINQIVLKLRAMEDRPGMSGIRRLKATFVEKMGDEQRLVRVADVLRAARPGMLVDIGRYLASLQPTTLPILLDVLETLDAPEHRLVLCDAIAEFCKVDPTSVIQRLSSERPMTVRDMVYVLERAQHPDRMQFFGRVLKHRNLAVRLDVMGTIARGRSIESRRLIAEALKDENAQVRVQAARLLPEYDREQAYQELVRVVKGKDFKKRSTEEQAAFYTALGSTGLPTAMSLMTQLLAVKAQLWNRTRVLEEKLLAVHGLAGVQSIQSYKVLQAVVENRSQPPEVLVAARRALAETRRKLFGDAAPPGGQLMADNLRISGTGDESILEFGRDHSEKLQQLSRSVLSTLYMLVRSAKMYDPDNAVFERPMMSLQDTLNLIVSREGRFDLVGIKSSFYVNNMLVKVELNAVDNIRYLLQEMRAKDVGGFTLAKPVQIGELKNFVWIFAKDTAEMPDDDGLGSRKLLAIKIARWSRLKEKLEREVLDDEEKVDRKKYAITVYARAVFFISKYLDSVRKGTPMMAARALRIVQDLVDICFDAKVHFLGMTTMRQESEYLVFHQVNTCLLSIVFGVELGLTKGQLRDLGFIALFHDAGMATLPDELAGKRGGLTSQERTLIAKAPLISVRNVLMEKGFTRTTLHRVVTTLEYKSDFGTAVRDARGNIQMIIPKSSLGLYAKIIAITAGFDALTSKRPFRDAYGPEVAMMLMWSELRHKFDPELLKVFMRVLAIPPVKVLSRRQQGALSVTGL